MGVAECSYLLGDDAAHVLRRGSTRAPIVDIYIETGPALMGIGDHPCI